MNTKVLLEKAKKHILFTAIRPDVVMSSGKGMYLWDTDGKKYLDFIGGWAVTCIGHSPDVIISALKEQAEKLVNASPAFYNDRMIEFAKLLTDISCFDKVFFASSGAEANESAIKLARKYGSVRLNGAYKIITTQKSFHGRTLATMAATGKEAWKHLFVPKVEGFIHVPFNDFDSLASAVDSEICAVMLEPTQGEGGVFEADKEYIVRLREFCDEKKILLIFDEVQTGLGRTGKLFAYEHYGIEPDIMTLAKGIGGGYPLSAMLAKDYLDIFEPGEQGGTYSSQPLSMAVGYAVVKEILDQNLTANAYSQGEYIKEKIAAVKEKFQLSNIRGKGLLLAFDLPVDCGKKVVAECLKEGLIVNSPQPDTIRLMPPLIVTRKDIDDMFVILTKALEKVLE